jgi:hypothetical protein
MTEDFRELNVKRATWRRWAPNVETIEGMRAALSSHWVMTTQAALQNPFWTTPASWLHRQTYHFASGGRLIK